MKAWDLYLNDNCLLWKGIFEFSNIKAVLWKIIRMRLVNVILKKKKIIYLSLKLIYPKSFGIKSLLFWNWFLWRKFWIFFAQLFSFFGTKNLVGFKLMTSPPHPHLTLMREEMPFELQLIGLYNYYFLACTIISTIEYPKVTKMGMD